MKVIKFICIIVLLTCHPLFAENPLTKWDLGLMKQTDLHKRYTTLTDQVNRLKNIDSKVFIHNLNAFYHPENQEWHKGMSLVLFESYYSNNTKINPGRQITFCRIFI